ncbi:MAG: hypothetical protein ACRDF4_00535, partial [Rhabdochlamydiaceae bacterium]
MEEKEEKEEKEKERSVFVLSGEELTFPAAEIRALVETYSSENETCKALSQRVVTSTLQDPEKVSKISRRAAYCRFGGRLVSLSAKPSDLTNDLDGSMIESGKSFAVASETLDRTICGEVGAS